MILEDFLKKAGYGQKYEDRSRGDYIVEYWCKKVPGTDRHQFVVKMWPPFRPGMAPSFEVEMVYETRNEIWANTKFYGLRYTELCANLERLEGCLKQSLLYMDANPLHYRFDGRD